MFPKAALPKAACPKAACPRTACQVTVTLTDADIPGALLNEPLEVHNVAVLKWWLLCRDIKLTSSCRKQQLIERYDKYRRVDGKFDDARGVFYLPGILYVQCRIREAKKEGVSVVDVDGSYLTRKIEKLKDSGVNTAPT